MALISADDVSVETRLTFTDTSQPSSADVDGFISEIEAEVSSLWNAAGGAWPPAAGTAAEDYGKLCERLGVKVRTYEVKFGLTSLAGTPDSLAQARLAYNDRLKRIPDVLAAIPGPVLEGAPAVGPLRVGYPSTGHLRGSSFDEWTRRRDWRTGAIAARSAGLEAEDFPW